MSEAALCAICHKRKAKRHCPGLNQSICAVCCGTEREMTVDCPSDCTYLRESRRYEWEKLPPASAVPFPEVEISDSFLDEHGRFIGQLAYRLWRYVQQVPGTTDRDLEGAMEKTIRTYETLSTGIYYESLPEEAAQLGVYRTLKNFLSEYEKRLREQGRLAGIKESSVIRSLIFLLRVAALHSSKRPRSRGFIDFLRQAEPESAVPDEEPRLIIPGV